MEAMPRPDPYPIAADRIEEATSAETVAVAADAQEKGCCDDIVVSS
jgi:hypothetical protein